MKISKIEFKWNDSVIDSILFCGEDSKNMSIDDLNIDLDVKIALLHIVELVEDIANGQYT